jgi:hypothetical protein
VEVYSGVWRRHGYGAIERVHLTFFAHYGQHSELETEVAIGAKREHRTLLAVDPSLRQNEEAFVTFHVLLA